MQEYSTFSENDHLNIGIPKLVKNIETIASNFSGNAFPTDNLFIGMTCYRTDLKKEYRLSEIKGNAPTWELISDASVSVGTAIFDKNGKQIDKEYMPHSGGSFDGAVKYSKDVQLEDYSLVTKKYVDDLFNTLIERFTPKIGELLTTENNENPSVRYPGTVWQLIEEETFIMSAGTNAPVGKRGGSNTHTNTTEEMASHIHEAEVSENGNHSHARGTMDITGFVGGMGGRGDNIGAWDANGNAGPSGAFYSGGRFRCGRKDGRETSSVYFKASQSWTGRTSSEGAHTHTVNIQSTGGGKPWDTRPKYRAMYQWIRIK